MRYIYIFSDLVTLQDKKAIVAQDVVPLRDEHQKYKESKARSKLRRQKLRERNVTV